MPIKKLRLTTDKLEKQASRTQVESVLADILKEEIAKTKLPRLLTRAVYDFIKDTFTGENIFCIASSNGNGIFISIEELQQTFSFEEILYAIEDEAELDQIAAAFNQAVERTRQRVK